MTDVLWSPEGDTLAVASADGNIYLYNNDDYAIKGRCGGHLTLAEEANSGAGKKSESKSEGSKEEGAGSNHRTGPMMKCERTHLVTRSVR